MSETNLSKQSNQPPPPLSADLVQSNSQTAAKEDVDYDTEVQPLFRPTTQSDPLPFLPSFIDKFDGTGDGEQWLKRTVAHFDSLHLSSGSKHALVPDLLTGDALFWYAQHQHEMPTFLGFIQRFLLRFTVPRDRSKESLISPPSSLLNNPTDSTESTAAVVLSLRHQMLLNSLDKLPKFSGRGTNNVSQWLRETEQALHLLKLPNTDKLFFISSCLESDARDWYFDNIHSMPTWQLFVQNFIQTFESTGTSDIAFNRLRHYQQGLTQDVRHYYFEIMKLCKQANPCMDLATKLQYLKDGLKSSLRFDVLMKDPATPEEFLAVAQRIAELKSLDQRHNDFSSSIPISEPFNDLQPLIRPDRHDSSRIFNSPAVPKASARHYAPPSPYQCYRCGSSNHYIRDCPRSKPTSSAPTPPSTYQCYRCGGTDHFIRNCPHFQ